MWDGRRLSREPLDVSGVWRFRDLLPFLGDTKHIVTLQEGNTPLLDAPGAAAYARLDHIQFKHQGYNPSASFKDNGMTAGIAQARALGMKRVACVSTGNTSASMAAYAAAGGLQAVIFLPYGKIAYGKLAQALEYGALTIQVEANFDQILALVRRLAEELGIYLLNSINPFRIEGQKTIAIEMLDQRGWQVPDWLVLPGGNLGNVSATRQGTARVERGGRHRSTSEACSCPGGGRSAVLPPFPERHGRGHPERRESGNLGDGHPNRCAVSWEKALREVQSSGGVVESVTEQENRRCQGDHRTQRNRLRARFGGFARRRQETLLAGRHRRGRRRRRSPHWTLAQRPRLRLSLPHGSDRNAGWRQADIDIWQSARRDVERPGKDRRVPADARVIARFRRLPNGSSVAFGNLQLRTRTGAISLPLCDPDSSTGGHTYIARGRACIGFFIRVGIGNPAPIQLQNIDAVRIKRWERYTLPTVAAIKGSMMW